MSIQEPSSLFLPYFKGLYIDPSQPEDKIEAEIKLRKDQMDVALEYLSNFETIEKVERCACIHIDSPAKKSSVCNLATYMLTKPWTIFKNALGFKPAPDHQIPVPSRAYETLQNTRVQFDRNLLGLFVITPTVIVLIATLEGVPLLITAIAVPILVTFFSGISPYVFSGDIGVVYNKEFIGKITAAKDRPKLMVQGGIRVDANADIIKAYRQLSRHLVSEARGALKEGDQIKLKKLGELAQKISSKFAAIKEEISNCGIIGPTVEDILAPLSKAIRKVRKMTKPLQESERKEKPELSIQVDDFKASKA
jgi:hypothetical protein